MSTLASAGARTYAPNIPTIVARYDLNSREALIATIADRPDGKKTAAITRVKRAGDGSLRRMAVLEFGAHRTQAIASLIDEILRELVRRNDG